MQHWIYRTSLDKFRLHDFIRDNGFVEYSQKGDIQKGDIVYLYITSPDKRVEYKMVVDKTNIPFNEQFNTLSYALASVSATTDVNEKLARLKLIGRVQTNDLSFSELKKHGFNYNTMPPYCKIDGKIVDYLEDFFDQKPIENENGEKIIWYKKLFRFLGKVALTILCSVTGIILASMITSHLRSAEEQEATQLVTLKEGVSSDVTHIKTHWASEPLSGSSGSPSQRINSFQSTVMNLVVYHGAHEISEFDCDNLEDSFEEAKLNISDRNTYDYLLGVVLDTINMVFVLDTIHKDPIKNQIIGQRARIRKTALGWLRKDSTRNVSVSNDMDAAMNKRDSIGFIEALTPFVHYKKDKTNYHFQKSFYDYLIKINNYFLNN